MTYAFECPHGHPLEAEPEQAGDQCRCPVCQTLFVVPDPPAEPAPQIQIEVPPDARPAGSFALRSKPPDTFNIPCPQGHLLETPREMLGQSAACPICGAEFRLREEQSREYQERQAFQAKLKDQRASKFWLNAIIVLTVIVVLIVVGLIVTSALN